jgi:hypothetical protein
MKQQQCSKRYSASDIPLNDTICEPTKEAKEKIMSSLSFDRVAHLYDATRGYPEVVAQQIVQAIDHAAFIDNLTAKTYTSV